MFLSRLALLFVAVASIEATVLPRDANTIVARLQTVSNDIHTLNNSLNGFTGGTIQLLQALQIQTEASQTATDTNNAVTAASQSAPLNDGDSAKVAFAVIGLSTDIYTVLDNLSTKRAAFESTLPGSSALVKSDLQTLKNSTDNLGAALTPKFVPTLQKLAPFLLSDIDFHFVRAIEVYS